VSKVQVASIVCDGPEDDGDIADCPHAAAIEDLGTVSDLRKYARTLGWRTAPRGRDRCPKCAAPLTP
jgi:hypothetical protein